MTVPNALVPATVLLVDDEPEQLYLLAQLLRMYGFSVLTACGPVEAMSIIAAGTERIDVAILDYSMPIMNGCVLADRLRSCCPEVKIILHSGAIDIPRREMKSVDAFVPKSDGVATLIAHVVEFAGAGMGAPTLLVPGQQTYFRLGSSQS